MKTFKQIIEENIIPKSTYLGTGHDYYEESPEEYYRYSIKDNGDEILDKEKKLNVSCLNPNEKFSRQDKTDAMNIIGDIYDAYNSNGKIKYRPHTIEDINSVIKKDSPDVFREHLGNALHMHNEMLANLNDSVPSEYVTQEQAKHLYHDYPDKVRQLKIKKFPKLKDLHAIIYDNTKDELSD